MREHIHTDLYSKTSLIRPSLIRKIRSFGRFLCSQQAHALFTGTFVLFNSMVALFWPWAMRPQLHKDHTWWKPLKMGTFSDTPQVGIKLACYILMDKRSAAGNFFGDKMIVTCAWCCCSRWYVIRNGLRTRFGLIYGVLGRGLTLNDESNDKNCGFYSYAK